MSGRFEPASAAPIALDHAPILLAIFNEAREVVIEGGVDHRVRLRRAAGDAVRILKRPTMRRRAGLLKPACAGIGACQPEHLVPGIDQFGHDPGADEAGRAG